MNRLFTLFIIASAVPLMLATSCKSGQQVKSEAQLTTESPRISSADLAQLKDAYKLNPDAAIISGTIKQVNPVDPMEVVMEVGQVERRGFSFKENINRGDKISVASRTSIKELKEGQSVLLVVSAFITPGTDVVYNLEKILATL